MIPSILPGEVLQWYFRALANFSTYAKKHQQLPREGELGLAPMVGMANGLGRIKLELRRRGKIRGR